MDMNMALDLEVREQCPQAEVVYDLFHVVAKLGREVIDYGDHSLISSGKHPHPHNGHYCIGLTPVNINT